MFAKQIYNGFFSSFFAVKKYENNAKILSTLFSAKIVSKNCYFPGLEILFYVYRMLQGYHLYSTATLAAAHARIQTLLST